MTALAILDLGYGNVDSIRLAFARLGIESRLTADPVVARDADRLVLPGVGAAGFAMDKLRARRTGRAAARADPPDARHLPWHADDVRRVGRGRHRAARAGAGRRSARSIPPPGRPVPHMGWTRIERGRRASGSTPATMSISRTASPATTARRPRRASSYGRAIPAALRQGHLWGAQFHPERSSAAGARFLAAFLGA